MPVLDGAAADSIKSLFQLLPQILDELEADAETNQGRGDPSRLPAVPRLYQRLAAAETRLLRGVEGVIENSFNDLPDAFKDGSIGTGGLLLHIFYEGPQPLVGEVEARKFLD